jgi:Tannase and feruloyl esterase
MLMYQGLADPIVTPAMTLAYYEAVESKSGDHGAPSSFLRLFMLPGLDHCGAQPGSGADRRGFDPLTALEPWVEQRCAAYHAADRRVLARRAARRCACR